MRLGSSIIGGKPMRIPGIVDVYQVGDEWVARSWPKVANQPNSAAQLLWRKKFKDAHALIKTWTGAHLAAWQGIECPTGKMWIDIAMTSILRSSTSFLSVPLLYNGSGALYYYATGDWFMPPGYYFGGKTPPYDNGSSFLNSFHHFTDSSQSVIKWENNGLICAKGKRPKIKWMISYQGISFISVTGFFRGTIKGNFAYHLLPPCPDGVTFSFLRTWIDPVSKENMWSLYGPPIKFFPSPMTEDWL